MRRKTVCLILAAVILLNVSCGSGSSSSGPGDASTADGSAVNTSGSDTSQEAPNKLEQEEKTYLLDYAKYLGWNLPSLIATLGEDYEPGGTEYSLSVVYQAGGAEVEFSTAGAAPGDGDPAKAYDAVVEYIICSGEGDLTDTGLSLSMDYDAVLDWCTEHGCDCSQGGNASLGFFVGFTLEDIDVTLYWDAEGTSATLSRNEAAPDDGTGDWEPEGGYYEEPLSPYDGMSDFEYLVDIHRRGTIDGGDILRNLSQYIGLPIKICGKVVGSSGITEGPMSLLVEAWNLNSNPLSSNRYIVYCRAEQHMPFIVGDTIVACGEIYGADQYRDTSNGQETWKDCFGINVRCYDSYHAGVFGSVGVTRGSLTEEEKAYWLDRSYTLTGEAAESSLNDGMREIYLTENELSGVPFTVTDIQTDLYGGRVDLHIEYDSLIYFDKGTTTPSREYRVLTLYYDGHLIVGEASYKRPDDGLYYNFMFDHFNESSAYLDVNPECTWDDEHPFEKVNTGMSYIRSDFIS